MTDLDTIYRAILIDPADSLARFAYADALEEAGDSEQAEFVRDMMEAIAPNRMSVRRSRRIYFDHHLRCQDPDHQQMVRSWKFCRQSPVVGSRVEYWIRRGLIDSVKCPFIFWMNHGQSIVASHPIDVIDITDRHPLANDTWRLDDGTWWGGYDSDISGGHIQCLLPQDLFELVASYGKRFFGNISDVYWAEFPKNPLDDEGNYPAKSAMNHAALMLIRERAGLPTWQWKSKENYNG